MKTYTIAVEELFYAEVEAESEKEAWDKYENDDNIHLRFKETTHREIIDVKD